MGGASPKGSARARLSQRSALTEVTAPAATFRIGTGISDSIRQKREAS